MQPGNIEVTGIPLEHLAKAAYSRSRPQGLGFMHFQEGDLTDEEIAKIIDRYKNHKHMAVSMDYVKGRSCKFHVRREGERLFIGNTWYDHSTSQLETLLSSVGLSPDLVAKAREEETKYHDLCVSLAIGLLNASDGTMTTSIDDKKLDSDISFGLYLAKDRGLVTEKYENGHSIWQIAKKAA